MIQNLQSNPKNHKDGKEHLRTEKERDLREISGDLLKRRAE